MGGIDKGVMPGLLKGVVIRSAWRDGGTGRKALAGDPLRCGGVVFPGHALACLDGYSLGIKGILSVGLHQGDRGAREREVRKSGGRWMRRGGLSSRTGTSTGAEGHTECGQQQTYPGDPSRGKPAFDQGESSFRPKAWTGIARSATAGGILGAWSEMWPLLQVRDLFQQ